MQIKDFARQVAYASCITRDKPRNHSRSYSIFSTYRIIFSYSSLSVSFILLPCVYCYSCDSSSLHLFFHLSSHFLIFSFSFYFLLFLPFSVLCFITACFCYYSYSLFFSFAPFSINLLTFLFF